MLGISTLLLALIASAANAAPLSEQPRGVKLTGCSITGLQLSLPASASVANMQLFTSESPTYVLLGRGVQVGLRLGTASMTSVCSQARLYRITPALEESMPAIWP